MFRYDNQDIVVIDGVVTRRDIAEVICLMTGAPYFVLPASHAEVIHYLKVQNERQ